MHRDEIAPIAAKLSIALPDNLGDVIYSFRYRTPLPAKIRQTAGADEAWLIRPAGKSRYRFVLVRRASLAPNPALAKTKVPDDGIRIRHERHCQLVPPGELTDEELRSYRLPSGT
ncbi:MAG: hypothetical protein C0502_00220 [Opitutus sp.]|nr:hypothetical protein [Opitutus sp.]